MIFAVSQNLYETHRITVFEKKSGSTGVAVLLALPGVGRGRGGPLAGPCKQRAVCLCLTLPRLLVGLKRFQVLRRSAVAKGCLLQIMETAEVSIGTPS